MQKDPLTQERKHSKTPKNNLELFPPDNTDKIQKLFFSRLSKFHRKKQHKMDTSDVDPIERWARFNPSPATKAVKGEFLTGLPPNLT